MSERNRELGMGLKDFGLEPELPKASRLARLLAMTPDADVYVAWPDAGNGMFKVTGIVGDNERIEIHADSDDCDEPASALQAPASLPEPAIRYWMPDEDAPFVLASTYDALRLAATQLAAQVEGMRKEMVAFAIWWHLHPDRAVREDCSERALREWDEHKQDLKERT
jgi:hypothetical protein